VGFCKEEEKIESVRLTIRAFHQLGHEDLLHEDPFETERAGHLSCFAIEPVTICRSDAKVLGLAKAG
jgi:hypothetical protein